MDTTRILSDTYRTSRWHTRESLIPYLCLGNRSLLPDGELSLPSHAGARSEWVMALSVKKKVVAIRTARKNDAYTQAALFEANSPFILRFLGIQMYGPIKPHLKFIGILGGLFFASGRGASRIFSL